MRASVGPIMQWRQRFASLREDGNFDTSDLVQVKARVQGLLTLLTKTPVLAWIVECSRIISPETCALPGRDDETERLRYARCMDHLITLLDVAFEDSPVSLQRILDWLNLQIATNESEDEPIDLNQQTGKTIALTVHKAKGLEFDYVILPNTWTPFGPPKNSQTELGILRHPHNLPRVIWRWSPIDQMFSNVAENEKALWNDEALEIRREETRLLYVALTRAKKELVVFTNPYARSGPPQTWGALTAIAGAKV